MIFESVSYSALKILMETTEDRLLVLHQQGLQMLQEVPDILVASLIWPNKHSVEGQADL